MHSSNRPYGNIFQSPSPPENALPGVEPQSGESYPPGTFSRSSDVASNSENLPRTNNEMTDLGSRRQINRATLQGRQSYDTIGRKVLLDGQDEGVAVLTPRPLQANRYGGNFFRQMVCLPLSRPRALGVVKEPLRTEKRGCSR